MVIERAVFFDIGNTFMYPSPSVPEVFTRIARRLGHDVRLDDVVATMPAVDAFYHDQYLRDGDFWCSHERSVQIWLDMYTYMAGASGITDGIHELTQAVYNEYLLPECWAVFDDVPDCMKELKRRGFHLGVISNWDATLEGLLRDMGWLPYFDVVIASAAVGTRKPHKVIFDIALERMGVQASQAVHVGDLVEADGEGAAKAGIRPVIIDRTHAFSHDCPYERITSLKDLPALL